MDRKKMPWIFTEQLKDAEGTISGWWGVEYCSVHNQII